MGFWHTGYIDFHEVSGIDEWCRPAPPIYRCPHCERQFESSNNLRQHRFQEHPLKRPILLIRGIELGSTPVTITQSINANDVGIAACATAIVNGVKMPVAELAQTLASIEHDTVRIILEGEDTTASFEIKILIASNEDMNGVEQAFFDLARHRCLDTCAIERFIEDAKDFRTGAAYCDGVCEYLYGLLAKEGSPECSLPFEMYREKFTRALDKLSMFDRPLANRIGGLIEFHFNQFKEAVSRVPLSRVGRASAVMFAFLATESLKIPKKDTAQFDEQIEFLLTDFDTEQLLRWATSNPSSRLRERAKMEQMLRRGPAEFDRTKLHILLAEMGLLLRDKDLVLRHARELRNSPSMFRWAENILETQRMWGKD